MRYIALAVAVSGSVFPTLSLAGPFSLTGNERWLVFASRKTQAEAVREAAQLSWKSIPGIRVVRAANGWFAAITGPMRVTDPRAVRADFTRRGAPNDLLFSKGDAYQTEVWRKYDGDESATMNIGELTIRVASIASGTGGDRAPIATGYIGNRVAFTMTLDE